MHDIDVQVCPSTRIWEEYEIPSSSNPSVTYTVQVPDPYKQVGDGNICSCPSYEFRGYCKHQQMVQDALCLWEEGISDEPAREDHTCPRCGEKTFTETVIE